MPELNMVSRKNFGNYDSKKLERFDDEDAL